MPTSKTLAHLARLYARDPDPWRHRTSDYERRKYARTLACVGTAPVGLALEVGCGNGALTVELARRCGRVVAVECIAAACEEARRAVDGLTNVEVICASAPDGLPSLQPDLVVLSEVLYYLTPNEIRRLGDWIEAHARPQARVLCVNWRGATGEALDGDAAVAHLAEALSREPATELEDRFRIDVFAFG